VFEATSFKTAAYGADEAQILTGGADRKITFWDAWDGQAIRTLEGGEQGEVGWLDMGDGVFVSGGGDGKVKVWGYDEGVVLRLGEGHSGGVNMVKIAPGGAKVVSVGQEGGIMIWDL
jgi:WD40 repeat protein